MKKTAGIFLLTLFLFNTIGYKALFLYLSQEADTRIEARIKDASNNDNGLISFKFPLQLPYLTDSEVFETAEGEVTVNGKIYKLVKKRILRDTLIVLCIDHKEKTRLEKENNDYFKKVNDLTSNSSKKTANQVKIDYLIEDRFMSSGIIPVIHRTTFPQFISGLLLPGHHLLITSPPELPLS